MEKSGKKRGKFCSVNKKKRKEKKPHGSFMGWAKQIAGDDLVGGDEENIWGEVLPFSGFFFWNFEKK